MSTLELTQFEERLRQAERFKNRFPGSLPVVTRRDLHCSLPESLHNQLFVVPKNLQASEFLALIRKKVSLARTHALMLFIDNKVLVTADSTIEALYSKFSSPDGFLYILCTDHETFGAC
jgi:hypothetical protein